MSEANGKTGIEIASFGRPGWLAEPMLKKDLETLATPEQQVEYMLKLVNLKDRQMANMKLEHAREMEEATHYKKVLEARLQRARFKAKEFAEWIHSSEA